MGRATKGNGYFFNFRLNGQKHGRGRYQFDNGDVYEGYFKLGVKDGQGIYTWSDKSFHKGLNYNNKKACGKLIY
jgi:hypothetical protein